MLAADVMLFGALFVFAALLARPASRERGIALWLSAGTALAAGLWSAAHFNWQAAPGAALAAMLLLFLALLAVLRRKPDAEGRARPIVGAGVLLLAATATAPYYFFPRTVLPAPSGPFAVGTVDFDLTDQSRRGVLDAPEDAPRRLAIRAWYPAAASSETVRPYFTDWEARAQAPSVARNWGLPFFALSHLRNAAVHGVENAPVAKTQETFPVIIYSHGYWGWAGQNTALMEELASRGYIVFSIGHPYDAGAIRFDDGEIIETSPLKAASETPDPAMVAFWTADTHDERLAAFPGFRDAFDRHRVMQSHRAWMADTLFLIETLQNGSAPEKAAFVAARADAGRLGVGGMSFGGQIAVSACRRAPSCKAAVNFDGGVFDWELIDADARTPVLMMHSDWVAYRAGADAPDPDFHLNDYAYETFETAGLNKDIFRMRVENIRHLGFTDLPLIVRRPLRDKAFGSIGGEEAALIMNDFAGGFFDRYVKGENNGFPETAYAKHPAVRPHDAGAVRAWRLANPERSEP